MTKKISDSLHSSLKAEQEAIELKFSKAEDLLNKKSSHHPQRLSAKADEIQLQTVVKIRRDGFSMTEEDYQLVQNIMTKFLSLGINPKRSEIYRLAIHVLAQKNVEILAKEFKKIHILKPGRK